MIESDVSMFQITLGQTDGEGISEAWASIMVRLIIPCPHLRQRGRRAGHSSSHPHPRTPLAPPRTSRCPRCLQEGSFAFWGQFRHFPFAVPSVWGTPWTSWAPTRLAFWTRPSYWTTLRSWVTMDLLLGVLSQVLALLGLPDCLSVLMRLCFVLRLVFEVVLYLILVKWALLWFSRTSGGFPVVTWTWVFLLALSCLNIVLDFRKR